MAEAAVAHVDAERGFSGGEVQVLLLIEGLAGRGFRSLLCCPPDSGAAAEARRRGIEVREVPMRHDLDLRAAWRLARIFREEAVDLVHLHTGRANALGGLAARWTRRPAITTRRQDGRVRRHLLNRRLYRATVARAVAISPAIAAQLADGGVPPERIAVIPSAVDEARLRPAGSRAQTRAALGLADGDVALLVLAALVPRKGVDVALDALARLVPGGDGPAVQPAPRSAPLLLIAGEGPERDALERRAAARRVGERVRFLGRRDDVADLLAACDVLVVPSRAEGLGIAALEAMAAGRPVVAADVGGLSHLVLDEGTGLLVPPGDPDALAGALARLLDEPALRGRLGAAGPARVDQGFRAGQMCDAYAALYREVLAETAR